MSLALLSCDSSPMVVRRVEAALSSAAWLEPGCTGVVVSDRWLLTAGHCRPSGAARLATGTSFDLKQCVVHDDASPSSAHDIAACRIFAHVRTVARVGYMKPAVGDELIVAGRGSSGDGRVWRATVRQVEGVILATVPAGAGCPGESGAPAFIRVGEEFLLIGLLSSRPRGERDCSSEGTVRFTSFSEVETWLRAVIYG